ncbi:hypothetical protein [Neogemmobacter tilapiae]|uniref:Glycerophosphoryl diester phosphodiesterase membrane domain-containing protein n=1 Tax=Neogemmobacter tilapiae TaxID=875041 RepID=A0A918TL85_9RHOB|nr:hypothetical protein [Gemmobacter tilapiae]GHC46939.1 hypothetical protein GCM10007315_05920 [Gemmobacter tilapiae]
MTDSTTFQAPQPLGVGSIISESFSILGRNILSVVVLALGPTLLGLVISGLLVGWGVTLGAGSVSPGDISIPMVILSAVIQIALAGVTTGLLIQLAYDAKLGKPVTPMAYIAPALAVIVPLTVLSFVAGLAAGIATLALIIPGLWVYAVFSVMPAAVIIEKVGFGGLGRSVELTREYRWPIVGAVILMGICNFVIQLVAGFVIGLIAGSTGIVGALIVMGLLSAVTYGLGSILVALIYARLREIKEGTSVRDIAAVFD